jgi:hypothetical protein
MEAALCCESKQRAAFALKRKNQHRKGEKTLFAAAAIW